MTGLKVVVKFTKDADDIWYVLESTVPGLHVEANSFEEMMETIEECVPMLLIENGLLKKRKKQPLVPMELVIDRQLRVAAAC